MRSLAFSTGCRMHFIRFVDRAVRAVVRSHQMDCSGREIADVPRLAVPPGYAHGARGSLSFVPLQHAGHNASVNPSSTVQLITAPAFERAMDFVAVGQEPSSIPR
jgi:hypothetical protein